MSANGPVFLYTLTFLRTVMFRCVILSRFCVTLSTFSLISTS